jgi:formiminoglutamate deiminase
MVSYWAEQALLPTGPASGVLLVEDAGRWTAIMADQSRGDAQRLPGVIMPGLANCHSHAFHRALRGRTHSASGTFWSWRKQMYRVADRIDPDLYLALARASYAEMSLAGITAVGEFHYLHHDRDGTPYDDPNAMAEALRAAARDAGVRLTLLDTCYLAGGLTADGHTELTGVQRRFGDGNAERWAERVAALAGDDNTMIGSAIHSVRAVPADQLPIIASATPGPLHVHVSEQPAENEATVAHYSRTPTELLAGAGVLSPRTTAVHAIHLTPGDITSLGSSRTTICCCPTTERDLADGIGPMRALADAGSPLSVGTDQHGMIDIFEEVRGIEMGERLASGSRGRFSPSELLAAATAQASIGWPDAGRLEIGCRADLVAVDPLTARTAGSAIDQLILVAGSADVHTVIKDGVWVVADGQHRLGNPAGELAATIDKIWEIR